MKKTYIQPLSTAMDFLTEGMIATSLNMYEDSNFDTTTDEQLTNKKNPIWDSKDKNSGGIW